MVVEVSNRAGNQSDLGAAFRFENPSTGLEALVSLATVLQCLCRCRFVIIVFARSTVDCWI